MSCSSFKDSESISHISRAFNNKLKKPIKYPVLDEASEFTEDDFWKMKLQLASRKCFPKNYRIVEDTLYFSIRKSPSKDRNIVLSEEPEIACDEFINFLKGTGNIYSDIDLEKSKLNFQAKTKKSFPWKISPNEKFRLIDEYVHREFTNCGVNNPDFEYLVSSYLKSQILTDLVNNTRVNIQNGNITSITGFYCDFNTMEFGFSNEEIKKEKMEFLKKAKKSTCPENYFSEQLHDMYIPELLSKKPFFKNVGKK